MKSKNRAIKLFISVVILLLLHFSLSAQNINIDWYSESTNNGITIQNSYPKGGPYTGPNKRHFNYSYLVFFSRIINETKTPIELDLNFSADSFPIPNSPNTYVKLFLPPDKMTLQKRHSFSYGVTELKSFNKSTSFKKTINPNEEGLFYVVAIFYQTNAAAKDQSRGGNRTELVLKGKDLYYKMLPQIDSLHCGQIIFKE